MENEYLYKLGVDASDLDAAISSTVSIIGELDNLLGQKMPRSTAAFVGGLEKVRQAQSDVAAGGKAVADGVAAQVAATEKATKATRDQVSANQALVQSYREAAVAGTSGAVGTSNQRNAALLNTQTVTGIGPIAAQQAYADKSSSEELAKMRAYYNEEEQLHQGMQDAIIASQNAAEKRRVASAEAQAKAIEAASAESAQQRIADEQRVTAELEALQNKQLAQFKAMQAQFVAEQQAYNQGNANRYGVATGDNLPSYLTSQTRNTAARNTSSVTGIGATAAAEEYGNQASSQQLNSMAAYYAAQEKTAQGAAALTAAQEKLGKATTAQSSNLPRLRYALYDVSFAFGIAGGALAGVGALVSKTTTEYQQLFAQVQRTSSIKSPAMLTQLKDDLIGVTTELPATFADVTKIATLGNQLNIPASALVNFTKTVTQFAAETNVGVDAAATAFGRLGEIFNTTDYKGLGDEIAYLGVNAVATESDIIKVAQQIAVTTTAYGLSEKQTLALATAYASLGIKAESARGTTSRAFSDIATAVRGGGTALEEIARVSGMSSDDFAKSWKTDANQAFITFVTGLGKSGANAKAILAELGITASRDVTNIGLLAANVNVLDKANTDAGKSAGYMDKAYQAVAGTVQSQLTIAGNKVQSIFNNIGTSGAGPIAGLVHGLNDMLDVIDEISKNPLAASGLGITVGIITLTGAVLLGIAALAAFKANALAIGTAIDQLGIKNASLGQILRTVVFNQTAETEATIAARRAVDEKVIALERLELAEEAAAAAGAQLAAANRVESETNGIAIISIDAKTAATEAGTAVKGLSTAATEVGAAAETGAAGVRALGAAGTGAAAGLGARGLLGVLGGPVGLTAMIGLTLLPMLPSVVVGFQNWIDKTKGAAVSTDQLTQSIKGLTAANAEQALSQVEKSLGTATERVDSAVNPNAVSGARAYANYMKTGSYVKGFDLFGDQQDSGKRAGTEIQTLDSSLASLAAEKNYAALEAGLKVYRSTLKNTGVDQKELDSLLTQTANALGATKGQTLEQAIATKKQGDAAEKTGQQTSAAADALTNYIADAFGATDKANAIASTLGALGKAYLDTGGKAASGSGEMQDAIKAIVDQAGDAPKAAAELETLYNTLVKMGLATPAQLQQLAAVIASYGGTAGAAGDAVPNITALADGYNKAAAAAAKSAASTDKATEAQKRTLMDYGSDLSSTFAAAFTYQFGMQDASDKIATGWKTIKDNAKEAAASIKEIKADLLSLNADKQQSEYDIKIASMYGDQIGLAKAKANLASTNNDIAGKQKDLTDAQEASSTKLTGNSPGAMANRANLEQQIQGYQGYITALAQSGASQKTIDEAIKNSRAEFVKQSTQLGLSKKDVEKYASSFEGMTKIVKAIPRNITTKVNVNTDPALKAIADYKSKMQDAQKTAAKKVAVPGPVVTPVDAPQRLGTQIGEGIKNGLNSSLSPQQQKNIIQLLGGTPTQIAQTLPVSSVGVPTYNFSDTPLAANGFGGGGTFASKSPSSNPAAWASFLTLMGDRSDRTKPKASETVAWQNFLELMGDRGSRGYADGGWTGNGGIYDRAGSVHFQEFVLNKRGAQVLPMADLQAMNQGRMPASLRPTIVVGGGGSGGGLSVQDRMFLAQVLAEKPAIQLSAHQFGRAIDGANVAAGMRGAG